MNTYVVKNIDNHNVYLEFVDGSNVKIRPNGKYIWQGPEETLDFLQGYIDTGKLQAWVLCADLVARDIDIKSAEIEYLCFDWMVEGF